MLLGLYDKNEFKFFDREKYSLTLDNKRKNLSYSKIKFDISIFKTLILITKIKEILFDYL
jgi:hypothetical protein